jgi:hypothetical protein
MRFQVSYLRSAFGVVALNPFSLTGLELPISRCCCRKYR